MAQKPAFLEPEYPFEWAGVFELAAGRYRLVVGPDPSMNVLVRRFEGDRTTEALGDEAEASFKLFSGEGAGVIPGMAVPLGALVTLACARSHSATRRRSRAGARRVTGSPAPT